jgi:hypothetical protein
MVDDSEFFLKATKELESGNVNEAIEAKANFLAKGNLKKAGQFYIQLRVKQLVESTELKNQEKAAAEAKVIAENQEKRQREIEEERRKKEEGRREREREVENHKKYYGVKGWLVLSNVLIILLCIYNFGKMSNEGLISRLSREGITDNSEELFVTFLTYVSLFWIIYGIYSVVKIVNKTSVIPAMRWYWLVIILAITNSVSLVMYREISNPQVQAFLIANFISIFFSIVWLKYFKNSKRVYETFTKPEEFRIKQEIDRTNAKRAAIEENAYRKTRDYNKLFIILLFTIGVIVMVGTCSG